MATMTSSGPTEVKRERRNYRTTEELRRELITMAERGQDFTAFARSIGLSVGTARSIVSRGRAEYKQRGGARRPKILSEPVLETLIAAVGRDSQITLRELRVILKENYGIETSATTIGASLDGRLITYKQLQADPSKLSIPECKIFADKFFEMSASGSSFIYLFDANFNIYTRRCRGVPEGLRSVHTRGNRRGPSINVSGAMLENTMLLFDCKLGGFKTETFNNFLLAVCSAVEEKRQCGELHGDFCLIIDDSPSHSEAEEILKDTAGLRLLRLPANSLNFNGMEIAWSAFQAEVQNNCNQQMGLIRDDQLAYKTDKTVAQHRIDCLMQICIDSFESLTDEVCTSAHEKVVSQLTLAKQGFDADLKSEPQPNGASTKITNDNATVISPQLTLPREDMELDHKSDPDSESESL